MIAAQATSILGPPHLTNISFFGAGTSTASTVTLPGGIQANDWAVLFDWADNSIGVPTSVTPTGFTAVGTSKTDSNLRWNISRKVLDGSESVITGMNGTSFNRKVIMVFRPSRGTWGSPASISTDCAVAGVSGQPFTTIVGAAPLVVVAGLGGIIGDAQMSPSPDATFSTPDGLIAAYIIYNNSPVNVSVQGVPSGAAQALGICNVSLS